LSASARARVGVGVGVGDGATTKKHDDVRERAREP
jgi:hypothetical protein